LSEHIHTDAITNAILGGDVDASLKDWAHQEVTALIPAITEYRNLLDDLDPQDSTPSAQPEAIADVAEAELGAAAEHAVSQIEMAAHHADHARRFQNAMMVRHNIDRPVHHPDTTQNSFYFGFLTVGEGLTTALFFLGGGFVAGIGEALGLGLTISGVNVLVAGLIGGGFFGRFWNYGINARHPDGMMRSKRLFGRLGSVMTALCLAGLLITSGIVRATGETEHLSFTLDTLGAAASDFHSLMLWAIGAAFMILAWRKGLSAFSDPYPGLSHASKAVALAEEANRKVCADAVKEIDQVHDNALEDIDALSNGVDQDREAWLEAVHDARHEREALLGEIATIESGFAAFAAEEYALIQMVRSRSSTNPDPAESAATAQLDLSYLRELLPAVTVNKPAVPDGFPEARVAALNRLSAAREAALEAVIAAQKLAPD
jgi:hypothetical protein